MRSSRSMSTGAPSRQHDRIAAGNASRHAAGRDATRRFVVHSHEVTINPRTHENLLTVDSADEAQILDLFRRWGYLQADLDPLGRLAPQPQAELDAIGDAGAAARRWYCGPIGADFMHIPDPARRQWIQERLEAPAPPYASDAVLDRLISAETFEEVL